MGDAPGIELMPAQRVRVLVIGQTQPGRVMEPTWRAMLELARAAGAGRFRDFVSGQYRENWRPRLLGTGGPEAGDQPRASPNRAINPEYLRVGELIAFSNTSALPTIVTPERERVTAV